MADISKISKLGEELARSIESLDTRGLMPNLGISHTVSAEMDRLAQERKNNIAALNHLGEVSKASLASEFCNRLENQIKLLNETSR